MDIFWFRRDLRLHDNAGLYHALKKGKDVQCIFIFDTNILDKLENKADPRVTFIHQAIQELKTELNDLGSDLSVYYGDPLTIWKDILAKNKIVSIYTNRDYERYANKRDESIAGLARSSNVYFNTFKDHVIFEGGEILKDDGDPYVVFTPYKRKWLAKLDSKKKNKLSYYFQSYPTKKYVENLNNVKESTRMIPLGEMGFQESNIPIPEKEVKQKLIKNYGDDRNYPSKEATSKLGVHFRFGTISIREKALKASKLSDVFLSELIWRDFYAQILHHFPHVEKGPFRKKYEALEWRNNEQEFEAWCKGQTGYPIVDAGMRELNTTGFMHNRVRMVTASFLTKHLLIDWRWGEAYFAEKLLDFDLASNNGGWQWAAGCGTDAAPYFRIFNPESQQKKFDKEHKYIKQWVPEWGTEQYASPIVDHKEARERCLRVYKEALQNV
ncbi:MAG: deoxyribodipyrimidine photo-lyase [Saprospiraceae bacterium]|nr:DNA photolyase family protein [Bacteroidia bacterium]NNE13984.1 deoxyribodipyrimidine photo-lyase [Saprospiraceae bacterium]NNL92756.1 deoxyribodipyrimidine photo-lyase [Saprospiraceae bacterium]